ncbi:unnamed protein product [Phytophthora fragariaefolia]|uniref:Unnamed protein product n=1 Tax=Phytophthora fragariaefolia TaxID=1490495 RepID=A0A9W6YF59_9STRA|nr:unnamed protein product [Phytophthora fragariaefolia]
MLASLRSEQSALLPSKRAQEDVEMDVQAGNDAEVERKVAAAEEEEAEEFISLATGTGTRSRVTFGVDLDRSSLSKATEVVEEESAEEEEEQSRRWEEELMRRAGHRVPLAPESKNGRPRDGLPAYPTRRKVACVSLGSVLGKLEKSLESTAFEDERALRELARLEAETALIETTLKQQQEELLVSSEEFDYFQEVQDFVKGLSFCLREKVKVIDAKARKATEECARQVERIRHDELFGAWEDIQFYLSAGRLQQAQVVGIDQLDAHFKEYTAGELSSTGSQRSDRLQKYQLHFVESYVSPQYGPSGDEDLFDDAIDEINSLKRVYGRFQEWKAKFPEVYKSTYCELAQEKLLAPYVQAELIYWDPLGVADVKSKHENGWSLDVFTWFRVLHKHLQQSNNESGNANGPILYQIRDVLLEKVRVAVRSYFDPYSSLQARSLGLLLEEINRHGYIPHVGDAVQRLMNAVLDSFSIEAKRSVLITIGSNVTPDVSVFAHYLLERFIALQDNLLTLFVTLPKGDIAATAFRCLMQVLHRLLSYVRHCNEIHEMKLVPVATQVVRQLSSSSHLLEVLSDPGQERELKHITELFSPYLQSAGQ